jgi:hypothetical protein
VWMRAHGCTFGVLSMMSLVVGASWCLRGGEVRRVRIYNESEARHDLSLRGSARTREGVRMRARGRTLWSCLANLWMDGCFQDTDASHIYVTYLGLMYV